MSSKQDLIQNFTSKFQIHPHAKLHMSSYNNTLL